jgi:hypothetical protein
MKILLENFNANVGKVEVFKPITGNGSLQTLVMIMQYEN